MGILLILFSQFFVAVNIVLSKLLVAYLPIYIVLIVRFFIGTVTLAIIAKSLGQPLFKIPKGIPFGRRDMLMMAIQGLCAGFLFNALMMVGLKHTSGAVAGVITSTLPAMVVVLAAIFLKERFGLGKWIAVSLATVGLVVINAANLHGGGSNQSLFGDLLIFLALIPEAVYYILARVANIRLPAWMTITWVSAINVIFFLPFAIMESGSDQIAKAPFWIWLVLVLAGVFTSGFFACWSIGVKKVRMQLASLAPAVMPIMAVLLSWLILGESLSTFQVVGMSLVIVSILFCARS